MRATTLRIQGFSNKLFREVPRLLNRKSSYTISHLLSSKTMFIELENLRIEIIRKAVKNLNLRIHHSDGRITLSIPLRYNIVLAKQYLQTKISWLKQKQLQVQNRFIPAPETFTTGSSVFYRGECYLLQVQQANKDSIRVSNRFIYCDTKQPHSPIYIKKMLQHWYRMQMQLLLPSLIAQWEQTIHVKVKQWGIKQMKTRWGSCNTQAHRIWLNLNLIQKPPICLEYVLVHELVHLLEPSHNHRFHTLMTQFMPEWRHYKKILERNEAAWHSEELNLK